MHHWKAEFMFFQKIDEGHQVLTLLSKDTALQVHDGFVTGKQYFL